MKVGVVSDSHDRLDAVDAAVECLNSRGVAHVLHAGDFISPFAASRFGGLEARLWAVYGNNDGDRALLRSRLLEAGCSIDDFLEVRLGGRRLALYHGTISSFTKALVESGRYDAVLTGHSHRVLVRRSGGTLLVNPGELCGYLSGRRTLCILDLKALEAEIVEL